MSTLELKHFDQSPNRVQSGGVYVIIGKRSTGKTYLAKDLIRKINSNDKPVPTCTVLSCSTYDCEQYAGICQSTRTLASPFDAEVVSSFLETQISQRNARNDDGDDDVDPRAILVLDNCMCDNGWLSDKSLNTLFLNCQSLYTTIILTLPYPYRIPPVMRPSICAIFMFKETYDSSCRELYDLYSCVFPKFEEFIQVLEQCTIEKGECLVIDNCAISNDVRDIAFFYRA
jgi:hypothetical protein